MPLFRSKAEDKVRKAGFDPARLPPGQYLTEKWPVLHAGDVPDVDLATWDLKIWGEVEEPVTLTFEQLKELPATEVTTDIHCVTRWSRFDAQFKGVHWNELAKLCRPKPSAQFVDRARGAGLHRELAAERDRGRDGADRLRGRRRAADPGSRLAGAALRPVEVLLEERQVAARPRALGDGQAGLLGALRLPQRGGLLEGRAVRVLGFRGLKPGRRAADS